MVTEEIYILTKHAKFQASYVESIPVYKRRYFLDLLEKENKMIQDEHDKMLKKYR